MYDRERYKEKRAVKTFHRTQDVYKRQGQAIQFVMPVIRTLATILLNIGQVVVPSVLALSLIHI